MPRLLRYTFLLLITAGIFASCSETRKKASDQLNELNEKKKELNTALDDGLRTMESLDSVIRSGADQLREYDTIIKNSTSRIDSIAAEKKKAWKDLTSF